MHETNIFTVAQDREIEVAQNLQNCNEFLPKKIVLFIHGVLQHYLFNKKKTVTQR